MVDLLVPEILDLQSIGQTDHPVVVEFYSNKCRHCNNFAEVFESAAHEYEKIDFYKMNLNDNKVNREQALSSEVRGLPTTVAFKPDDVKSYKVCASIVGNQQQEDFNQWLDLVLKDCSSPIKVEPVKTNLEEIVRKEDSKSAKRWWMNVNSGA